MSTKCKLDTTADSSEVSESKRPAGALHQYTEANSFLSTVLCADVCDLIANYLYRDPDYLYVMQCDNSRCDTHRSLRAECCLRHINNPSQWICEAAVKQNRRALLFAPEPHRTDALYLAVVQHNGWALQYVPEPRRTEALCLAAVKQDGRALYYAPKPLQTEAICLAAVQQNGYALIFVPEPLRAKIKRMVDPVRAFQ